MVVAEGVDGVLAEQTQGPVGDGDPVKEGGHHDEEKQAGGPQGDDFFGLHPQYKGTEDVRESNSNQAL